MADFKNEMSWSRSRISTLHHCKRQYYYQYYLKWDGWSWDAPERRKLAYRLSKMSNLYMLVGTAVHDTIKVMLEQIRDEGEVTEPDPSLYARREILTRAWREAQADLWKRNPKRHPPIYELYYRQQVPPERLKEMGAKVTRCLGNFEQSALFQELKTEDASCWRAVDPDFDQELKVSLDGHNIWAIPDFARETADGSCEIWDWKTGRENPADEIQLRSYALFARDKWGYDPEQIRLFGMYLDQGDAPPKITEYGCSSESLQEIEATVHADFKVMHGLLDDVTDNVPKPEADFEQIEPGPACDRCFFRELCDR